MKICIWTVHINPNVTDVDAKKHSFPFPLIREMLAGAKCQKAGEHYAHVFHLSLLTVKTDQVPSSILYIKLDISHSHENNSIL